MKPILTILLSLLLFPISLISGCSSEPPIEVTTEKVLSGDALTLIHDGEISLSNELKIFAPISGNVMEKYVEDDSVVEERQMLFKISDLESHAELLQAKKELAESMTALAKSAVENDAATAELQVTVEENQERVQNSEEAEARGIIYAPKAGRLNKVAQLGMVVVANETILATVGDINPVVVTFEMTEAEKNILSAADDAKISLKLGNGSTYSLNGTFEKGAIYFDNPDGNLNLGDAAQVVISGVKIPNALLVPEGAVQNSGADNFVYINKNNEAAVRKILLGDKIGTYYIVKDGLRADDMIIVDGFKTLREGSPLKANDKKIGGD